MNESRFIEYPNAWCPLTDPHRAMMEAITTIGFARTMIENAEAQPEDEWKAYTAISALKWIVQNLEANFREDYEARLSRTQEAFESVMTEDDFVQAGIAAREAIKNIKQKPTVVMVEEYDEEPKSMSEQIVHAQNIKTNEQ